MASIIFCGEQATEAVTNQKQSQTREENEMPQLSRQQVEQTMANGGTLEFGGDVVAAYSAMNLARACEHLSGGSLTSKDLTYLRLAGGQAHITMSLEIVPAEASAGAQTHTFSGNMFSVHRVTLAVACERLSRLHGGNFTVNDLRYARLTGRQAHVTVSLEIVPAGS
ncbi:hypothetical protein E1281_08200 [Actinomadura sp. KC345]|uniref:hypothetical protein n=1 Tax=Actinomadura sp. KC345 TaxID=2530371 RepID=UPI00104464C0|nr:hypothetical protein [Actinomadura sp. KC345]TDC56245.1 hypothetical protein E1281_08200 [Actinomadura sp. KC345]